MKTYKLRFKTDPDIPVFKQLHIEEADLPIQNIIRRGIHPESMNHEPSYRELSSLRSQIYKILNDTEHKIAELTGLGYGDDQKEPTYYYSYQDLASSLARIAKNIIFVEDINYTKLVELATKRLREIWKHETARDLAQAVYPDFNYLRDFLKTKERKIKLSGYKDLDKYNLATIISIDDFEGQDKAIIALAIEHPNFRKTTFLNKITTLDDYLSLTERFDWFGLILRREDERDDQELRIQCEVESDRVHLMPDTGTDTYKREKAEMFAKKWSSGSGKYCLTVSLDIIAKMLEESDITITFNGFRYDNDNNVGPSAYMRIRGPTVKRFSIQKYPTINSTNDLIKGILAENEVSMTGRKDALIEKLVKLATDRYKALSPVLDSFFTNNTYIKIPQPERKKGEPFPVLKYNPLDQLTLGIYIVRHLRGNVVLDASSENTTVGISGIAHALINKKIDLDYDFIAVEQKKPMEVKP